MGRWVVVGGGTAGCVVAARLSERPGDEVVLLEAGPDHGPDPVPGDVGALPPAPGRLRIEHVVRRSGRPPEPYPQGAGLGGSSLVNGGLVAPFDVPAGFPMPLEAPWADGAVGAALLAAHRDARRVLLVRSGGRRVTAFDHVLRPRLERGAVSVRTGAEVRRVILDGRRAVGVQLADGSEVGGDAVVLCAGAIRTPTILLRSGVDTPGIGRSLSDHPAMTLTLGLCPSAVDPSMPATSVGLWEHRHHVLAMNHLPGHAELGALVVGLHEARSRGSVTLPDADGEPLVELHQFADPSDLDRLTAAVGDAIALLSQPVWRDVVDEVYVDDLGTTLDAVAETPDDLRAAVGRLAGGHLHAAGTCGDGRVTERGVVLGHEQLYAADASVFARTPPRNPYAALVVLADRLAAGWPSLSGR